MTTAGATERYGANAARGDLGLAQDLANTIGVGSGADLLASTAGAQSWLQSITGASTRALRDADLVRMRSLRTAIRSGLDGDGGDESAEAEVTLRLHLDHSGVSLPSAADPVDAMEARVTLALIEARARGELSRLKLCANPRCRVAFFDESRNGAGRWHSPATCGNAARVRAYRDRTV